MDTKIVNIIAGGSSVAAMNVKEICLRGYTIGVNDSAVLAPVHIGVSMDRRWSEYRLEQIRNKPFFLRKVPKGAYSWEGLWLFKCDHESNHLTDISGHLNGKNSGYCALNLAYQMKPKKVYLFGFDMQGSYWYPPYPWCKNKDKTRILPEWPVAFQEAKVVFDKAGIEVFIVGESKIDAFPKITYEEFLRCTK